MNKTNHKILSILLDCRYIAQWYTVHTISKIDRIIIIQTEISLSNFRMPIKTRVFWVNTSRILVYTFRNVGGTCCSHLQGSVRVHWRYRQQDSSSNSRISCYKSIPIFIIFKVCCYALLLILTFFSFLM
jgi:hypothetical protein